MDDIEEETSQPPDQNNESENLQRASSSRVGSLDEPRSQASRTRRLVSQSTLQEGELDNSVLNSQQQYVDLDEDSENDDQLFEAYVRENAEVARSQARMFNNELPANHSYLGENMDIVRGSNVYESGKVYEIPVCGHHSMVFPGEIIPMIMIAESIFSRTPESNEGLTFGLVFTDEIENDKAVYGVTCQVFEKGVDVHGHITVKSKAHQRFVVVRTEDGLTTQRNHSYYAKVRILPEYILPDPVFLASDNIKKFTQNPSQTHKIKSFCSSGGRWPKFVYDLYSIVCVEEKIERYLAMLNITAPDDLVPKSFWLARNMPLSQADRLKIFTSNCVNKRMMLIGESLNFMCYFNCKRCRNQIASYADIFAMAKGNVNANYCNPAGYIHETLTVKKTSENAARLVERPSTDFSWFPEYAWQIAQCKVCSSHIGWKFIAVTKNLTPKTFFGLSCKSLVVAPKEVAVTDNILVDDSSSSDD